MLRVIQPKKRLTNLAQHQSEVMSRYTSSRKLSYITELLIEVQERDLSIAHKHGFVDLNSFTVVLRLTSCKRPL